MIFRQNYLLTSSDIARGERPVDQLMAGSTGNPKFLILRERYT